MKNNRSFSLVISIFILLGACKGQPGNASTKNDAIEKPAANGFAVVELFTSQGCSSCPSADKLLGKLIAQYGKEGKQLIALSFHVDYWNRLGWKDPFSQAIFTQRQNEYANKMQASSVYTPQAVINGQWETVGSSEGQINQYIARAFAQIPTVFLQLKEITLSKNTMQISYALSGAKASSSLHFAIVQNQALTQIKAGENDGVSLFNYNIVRGWKTVVGADGNQAATIDLPAGYNAKDFAVFGFVQNNGTGAILAASRL